jgi:hypothetical protein
MGGERTAIVITPQALHTRKIRANIRHNIDRPLSRCPVCTDSIIDVIEMVNESNRYYNRLGHVIDGHCQNDLYVSTVSQMSLKL